MKSIRSRHGYIALVSVLMIMAVFLVVTSAVALSSFLVRSGAGTTYYKEISRSLAESCIYTALLRVSENAGYSGPETITVATSSLISENCSINGVSASGTSRVVSASAAFENAETHLRVTVDADLNISGWEELTAF